MQVVFWISFAVLFYTYLGYGLLLLVLTAFVKRKGTKTHPELPPLTLVVPAFREAAVIEKKIQNSLSLHYPEDRLFFLFVTDGPDDGTNAIIRQYPQVSLLAGEERRGKTAAINRAMLRVGTPIVVFTDANTLLHPDCLLKMMPHYADQCIGGVAGEKRIFDREHSAVGTGERLYWCYESLLKKAESGFYSVVGAAGELFSIRTSLFQPVSEHVILDDFVLSARVCLQGYRFVYEEGAFATETSSLSFAEERKRKTRISAGCFQALLMLKGLLNPFLNFRLAFQYLSHRVFRWVFCPLCLPLFFLANAWLALTNSSTFFDLVLAVQIMFYLAALAGMALRKHRLPQLLQVPHYVVFMNLSLYAGFWRFVTRRQTVMWAKAVRKIF
ncbi:glycosyltransferase family 2 protein [Flavisolibacter nicotianae]|uniref:glycosyltransferase family 2 protein n=1 Tax=Flavisolibacter nicotianae TaxID=2364882 RepID=UPI000EB3F535|nr:glycosyltransferase family 2 protein [Flavisolibacter nicotianae]